MAEALLISTLDFGWVVITVGLALGVPNLFNLAGVYTVFMLTFIVTLFPGLQLYAIWSRY